MAGIFYSLDRGPMTVLELGCLSSWEPIPVHSRVDSQTAGGRVFRQHLYSGMRWRVGIDVMPSGAIERQLATLSTHLGSGKTIGFARDTSKAWCAYLTRAPIQGDTTITTGGQVWHGDGDSTLADGDELVLASMDGIYKSEILVCAEEVTHAEFGVDVDAPGVQYSHSGVAWLRHRYYLPSVHIPADAITTPYLRNQNRRIFTLELVLELAPANMAGMYATNEALFDLGNLAGAGLQGASNTRRDLDSILNGRNSGPFSGQGGPNSGRGRIKGQGGS